MGFEGTKRRSLPLARSVIMKFAMNQQTATISFAIIFLVVFGLYFKFFIAENSKTPTSTAITEVVSEEESVPEFIDVTPDVIFEEDNSSATSQESTSSEEQPPAFDSFNEDALGKEFDDIQTGIDLLNNPLR